jgi:hypothetical protein
MKLSHQTSVLVAKVAFLLIMIAGIWLVFAETLNSGWRWIVVGILFAAFSPTDVMPLTHRAKYVMLVQSTISLALFGLVVARAVNAFT